MRYVAFLRAINVGGHVVTMDRLRGLFEASGFSAVQTILASGNVLFDAPSRPRAARERQIAGRLRADLGYDVATFLRSLPELESVLARNPFPGSHGRAGARLFVGFLAAPAGKDTVTRVHAAQTKTDAFLLDGRELYWLLRGSYADSPFGGPRLEKLLGVQTTLRNANTLDKIVAKASSRNRKE